MYKTIQIVKNVLNLVDILSECCILSKISNNLHDLAMNKFAKITKDV